MQKPQGLITKIDIPNLMLGLLLCALLIAMNMNSAGVVRQGGEDEGSGIGGTGRLPVPGSESGLGGTGLRPFVGLNEQSSEVEIMIAPADREASITGQLQLDIEPLQAVPAAPVAPVVSIADLRFPTTDSSPVLITEQMQREADINALYFERQQAAASSTSVEPVVPEVTYPEVALVPTDIAARASTPDFHEAPAVASPAAGTGSDREPVSEGPATENPVPEKQTADDSPAGAEGDQVSWSALASLLADKAEDDDGARMQSVSFDETDEPEAARTARPERIQRPELPPVQRVRPIQRAAILPPRVKPLRL